jgi:hypothetical protein
MKGLSTVALTAGAIFLSPTAGAATHIPYGPGPKDHYTVQAQPAAGHCHYRATSNHQPLPDLGCTPGALNPKVTQKSLATTICKSGYTKTIRPPESVTEPEKVANARSYGYKGSLSVAEYDHLVPLEVGGDPNDRRNLWVELPSPGHRASSGVHNPKDTIESQARSLVCAHKVGLAAMQRAIVANWTTAIAVVTHVATRSGGSGSGAATCSARVSDAAPAQYSTVDVFVTTKPSASVTTTAHYKSTDTTKTARADGAGSATVAYKISRATKGYTVVVAVTVAVGSSQGHCATSFTPR